jgi:23S rRNA-/tRNA-specific pseudouridylate synthase
MLFRSPQAGQRLDVFLNEQLPTHSRAEIQRWIRQGHVLVNGRPTKV